MPTRPRYTNAEKTHRLFGGPGSGKTTALLDLVESELKRGIAPEQIAFVAFTRAAAIEARTRAQERFGLKRSQLPWFRTLHSLAYEGVGVGPGQMMKHTHWVELGALLGISLTGYMSATDGPVLTRSREGERLRYLYGLAQARQVPIKELWQQQGAGLSWSNIKQFVDTLSVYKDKLGLFDFDDLLREFAVMGSRVPVKVVMIDEAQDLTRAQWAVVAKAFSKTATFYVAGDDDQALYEWAGADTSVFLDLPGKEQVLPISYRLPKTVFRLAQQIISQVRVRREKDWRATDRAGEVRIASIVEDVDLTAPGSWLLLARNRYLLKGLAEACNRAGMPYLLQGKASTDPGDIEAILAWGRLAKGQDIPTDHVPGLFERLLLPEPEVTGPTFRGEGLDLKRPWYEAFLGMAVEQREFYRAALRRNESLVEKPRVRISTIHGAKGWEADHVVVLPDLAARTYAGYEICPDIEHRAFYVAVTRAKKTLHLVLPNSQYAYPLAGSLT